MTTLRVASCGQSVSNVVITVMLTFLINFYKQPTKWKMEIWWLISIFHIPLYKTASVVKNGNLVVAFHFSYLVQAHHSPYGKISELDSISIISTSNQVFMLCNRHLVHFPIENCILNKHIMHVGTRSQNIFLYG